MKKILAILGTRPEVIKMAPVIRKLKEQPDLAQVVVCATGQHRQILDQTLAVFGLQPDFDLGLMEEDQLLALLTARALVKLTEVLEKDNYHSILVQGDTTTAMVAALAAFYKRIPIAHIEAGLRTGNPYNPFPEEVNRRLITVMAYHHFAPTQKAVEALLAEGVSPERVHLTGNTVLDALQIILGDKSSRMPNIPFSAQKRLILVTAHRRESFGIPLENICEGLRRLAERNPDVQIVYPVHPNPNVRNPVFRLLQGRRGIHLIEPLDYGSFVQLMNHAYLILTDSGGVQEEAPALGKPVLVLRQVTERPEGIDCGAAKIVGYNPERIVEEAELLLSHQEEYDRMAQEYSPYGDGRAAERIVSVLVSSMEA